jgi:hypothetical protein
MERGLYHPIEFSCEHMAVVETGDVENGVIERGCVQLRGPSLLAAHQRSA